MSDDVVDMLKKRSALKETLAKKRAEVDRAKEAVYEQERACGALEAELAACEKAIMDGMAR